MTGELSVSYMGGRNRWEQGWSLEVLCFYEVNVPKWRGWVSSHIHIHLQKLYKHQNRWKVGGMATPASTYSYPHVRNKMITCHLR